MDTPPLSPSIRGSSSPSSAFTSSSNPRPQGPSSPEHRSPAMTPILTPNFSPDFALPPSIAEDLMEDFSLGEPSLCYKSLDQQVDTFSSTLGHSTVRASSLPPSDVQSENHVWRSDMSEEEKDAREAWLAEGRGRSGLRIVIVTENFLPKVDGVTRTLARLLEHLEKEGHQCMLLGPGTGMSHYASHPLVGTAGVPLVVYPGLKLNFLRPKFLRTIRDFQPDVVHFVDPIWLGAQTLMAMELGWAGEDWVSEAGPTLGAGIRGAVVASYHTNLATYATLFGMAWLEPIMWKLQAWLYSKTLITLCPSPSTLNMLEGQSFSGVRLWPRGVDLTQFGPYNRTAKMRASWGVGESPSTSTRSLPMGKNWQGQTASLPVTPPLSPLSAPLNTLNTASQPLASDSSKRVVLLYVGRVSWEKNLHMLLAAYPRMSKYLTNGDVLPKLVFVGDGPARVELEAICAKEGYDATFMGHRSGKELAECYASADVFAFPSFTETFGQVVLEALASGLPVVGLDAEGTRDLVKHEQTGLLLPLPTIVDTKRNPSRSWPLICRDHTTPLFLERAEEYARLLARSALNHEERREMGLMGSTEGIKGYTWWDAMERCVDGYRESMRESRQKKSVQIVTHSREASEAEEAPLTTPSSPRISRMNRVVSRRLAHRGAWTQEDEDNTHSKKRLGLLRRAKSDTSETIWHLKTLLKLFVTVALFYGIYSHHLPSVLKTTSIGEASSLTA